MKHDPFANPVWNGAEASKLVFGLLFLASCTLFARDQEMVQEQVSQREDIRLLQEKMDQIQNDLQATQRENEAMDKAIAALKTELTAIQKSNEQYQKDIGRLDGLIQKLDAARAQDRKVIVEEVAREIAKLSKKSTGSPSPPSAKTQEGVEHTVEKGQTLTAIAEAYGVTKQAIRDANGMTDSILHVGQKLFIPKK